MKIRIRDVLIFTSCLLFTSAVYAEPGELWRNGAASFALDLPSIDDRAANIARETLKNHMDDFFDVGLPLDNPLASVRIVAGNPQNNPAMARLVNEGLKLTNEDLGDEGFQLLTFETDSRRVLVLFARTPRALKHSLQELLFFRVRVTAEKGVAEWPMNVVRTPKIRYRGIYILPCWAQHDSIESWKRVFQFNSELTLNRCWFWLDGFPVAGHPAVSHVPGRPTDYDRSPLASNDAVRSLIELSNHEEMKFLIGGGWMNWHHEQVAGKDPIKARNFYLDYLKEFPDIGGFYFEPTGEAAEVKEWRPEAQSLKDTVETLLSDHSSLEVAIAIGRFNNSEWRKLLSDMDPSRVFWWWCWGEPHIDNALTQYPSVLGWHTTVQMSAIHGTTSPPRPIDERLAGIVTSYDPGMGFGNPWNGSATLGGAPGPRNFDPYTMPYFSHEYRYREYCWNTQITEQEYANRLASRLFDADMPIEAIEYYLKLADYCFRPETATAVIMKRIEEFVGQYKYHGTPRNRDTLKRMTEATLGLRKIRGD